VGVNKLVVQGGNTLIFPRGERMAKSPMVEERIYVSKQQKRGPTFKKRGFPVPKGRGGSFWGKGRWVKLRTTLGDALFQIRPVPVGGARKVSRRKRERQSVIKPREGGGGGAILVRWKLEKKVSREEKIENRGRGCHLKKELPEE